jgi:catechol 2,3-dioxygenase-like lactoylglutathione lyase family enzyme
VTQLRVACHTDRLAAVVAFYRDGLGSKEIGGFDDHDGYDGRFPRRPRDRRAPGAHLRRRPRRPGTTPESLLVLYLGDEAAVRAAAARLGDPVRPANPYWAEHGLTFEDPDGFRVVLVPERWDG